MKSHYQTTRQSPPNFDLPRQHQRTTGENTFHFRDTKVRVDGKDNTDGAVYEADFSAEISVGCIEEVGHCEGGDEGAEDGEGGS